MSAAARRGAGVIKGQGRRGRRHRRALCRPEAKRNASRVGHGVRVPLLKTERVTLIGAPTLNPSMGSIFLYRSGTDLRFENGHAQGADVVRKRTWIATWIAVRVGK